MLRRSQRKADAKNSCRTDAFEKFSAQDSNDEKNYLTFIIYNEIFDCIFKFTIFCIKFSL